jgi:hypothetical protein
MSANVYTIEELLIGKTYRSATVEGEIISAEIHPKGIYYQDSESFLVQVRPTFYTTSGKSRWFGNTVYRTLAVKAGA